MSKFLSLWKWISKNGKDNVVLSFDECEKILGFPIDHSFSTFKKELIEYGFSAKKVSLKNQTVSFSKLPNTLYISK